MDNFESLLGFFGWFIAVALVVALFFYIFYSYCNFVLSKKLEVKYPWMAWIPFLSYINFAMIAGKTNRWIFGWFGTLLILWVASIGFVEGNPLLSMVISFGLIFVGLYIWISVSHGTSKRTGHGTWWTVGLIFASWLFIPVTAFHYEKGDEITPRPFTGVKKFFLIFFALGMPFLMVGGILAAALFPTMTAYQSRGNDTQRTAHIREIYTALQAYQLDNMSYPKTPTSGCIPQELSNYLRAGLPKDLTGKITPGCDGSDGQTYAYRTGKSSDGTDFVVVGAIMDTMNGNSNESIDNITPNTPLMRGMGNMYYSIGDGF